MSDLSHIADSLNQQVSDLLRDQHQIAVSFDGLQRVALAVKDQRDRLASAVEKVIPILDSLCGDGPTPPINPAQIRADLCAVLFDIEHFKGDE